jgi:hypothetical protein
MTTKNKSGKVIYEFIEKVSSGGDLPKWHEILAYLEQVDHPTAQGRPWRQSSAQTALKNHCRDHKLDYPLRQRQGTGVSKSNEITITLRITLPAGQNIKVLVE